MDLGIVNIDLFEAHVHYKRSMNRDSEFVDYSGKLLTSFPSVEISLK